MAELDAFHPFAQLLFLTLDAFKQFIEVDRFLVVIRDADAQGFDHILFVGAAGQQDAFEQALFTGVLLQVLGEFDAIHVRHVQVTQHQTDCRVCVEALNGFTARLTGHAPVATAFQKLAEFFDDQGLVVDHQYFYERAELVHAVLHAWQACSRQTAPLIVSRLV